VRDHEEQVHQAGIPAATAAGGATAVEKLEALGVRGILLQLARDGQIVDVCCEMPQVLLLPGSQILRPEIASLRLVPDAGPLP
jgi:hypothetical protein